MDATTSNRRVGARGNALLVAIGGALAAFLFFWPQFLSGFNHLYGDGYDGAIENVLVSHWHWVFQGLRAWNEPGYFYPRTDVLGYNDGYFLFGVFASFFRFFGLDGLRAGEYAHVIVRLIGYFTLFALLQRLADRRLINVTVALVFSIALNSLNGTHLQLLAVSFSPAMTLLALVAFDALRAGRRGKFCVLSITWAAFYGAWLMTGFYMAFFFGLFLIVFVIAGAALAREEFNAYVGLFARNWSLLIVFLAAFVLSTVPFLLVYLPKLGETGGQSILDAMVFAQRPIDLLNIGPQGLLWGKAWQYINAVKPGLFGIGEHITGFQPLFLLLMLIGAATVVKSGERWLMALSLACVVLALLVIQFHGHSLWTIVYYAVPGGKGVRVIARLFIFLVFPMSILVAVALHRMRSFNGILLGLLLVCLVVEQVNAAPDTRIDVPAQLEVLNRVTPAPSACRVFYAVNPSPYQSWSADAMSMYINIQAMQVADRANLPTINGVATFIPPDWNFKRDPADTYTARIGAYAKAHHITGLCQYDITAGRWTIE
jgi:hypothetical protein